MENLNIFFILISCILLSAFYSGMESAFISANKLKIEIDKSSGNFTGKIIAYITRQPAKFYSALLVGNTLVIAVYAIHFNNILLPYLSAYISNSFLIVLVEIFISAFILLIFGEFIPKAFFQINPNRIMQIFAVPAFISFILLYPIVILFTYISELFLKIIGQNYKDLDLSFGRIDLDHLVKEATEENPAANQEYVDHEIKIFKNALEFSELKVRDCMTPRKEIIAIDLEDGIEILQKKFEETGLSKILVYKDSIDNILGYVHSFSLFKKPTDLSRILIKPLEMRESYPAQKALSDLVKDRKSMAVIIDEFGGISGLLTTEDLMEEIFGEIEDEHDTEDLKEQRIDDNEFILSARLEIKYLNEKYNLGIPESEVYSTLAGFIIDSCQSIPTKNEVVQIDQFEFIILETGASRIEEVKLTIKEA